MDFFGMGMGEVLLILVVALIIWGPGKIVDISRTMGKIVHDLKNATHNLTTQITLEAEEKEKKTSTPIPNPRPSSEQEQK